MEGAITASVSTSGIDPKYFSGKSCRSGLASHANAEGVSMAEIKHRGGLKQKANTKLPYPLESLQGAREKYWVNSPPGSAGLSQRVLWIALAIAVQDGKRLSNLVLPAPGAQDHTARRTDMKLLEVASG